MKHKFIGTDLFYKEENQIETLGERIKKIRKLNEMNQKEFSHRVGISQATLSELEKDKYKPSIAIIISIVNEFHVDLSWLVLGITNLRNKDLSEIGNKAVEFKLLMLFNRLNEIDKTEIIQIINSKLSS